MVGDSDFVLYIVAALAGIALGVVARLAVGLRRVRVPKAR
jgi:hypothetical protein